MDEPSRCRDCGEVELDVFDPVGTWGLELEVSIINSGTWDIDNGEVEVTVVRGFDVKLDSSPRIS